MKHLNHSRALRMLAAVLALAAALLLPVGALAAPAADSMAAEQTNALVLLNKMAVELTIDVHNPEPGVQLKVVGVPVVGATFEWYSDNENVAMVDHSGYVTARGEGVANIMIRFSTGDIGSCVVSVVDNRLTLNTEELKLVMTYDNLNPTSQLEIVRNCAPNEPMEWWSDNPSIATVDQTGLVTAKRTGQTFIYLYAGYGERVMVTVNITSDVGKVTLDNSAIDIESVGGKGKLNASVAVYEPEKETLTWTSSNPKIAAVDAEGNVTAVGEGTATIRVTCASSGKSAEAKVYVGSRAIRSHKTRSALGGLLGL